MDNERHATTRSTRRNTGWIWVLLLPLFFIMGWFANDALTQNINYQAEPGVGSGPFDAEESATSTPTVLPTLEPTEPEDESTVTPEASPTPFLDDTNQEENLLN